MGGKERAREQRFVGDGPAWKRVYLFEVWDLVPLFCAYKRGKFYPRCSVAVRLRPAPAQRPVHRGVR